MKVLIIIFFLPFAAAGQVLPNANTIIVKGVGFGQVCNALLDSGYVIDKKDNDLQTVRTESKEYPKMYNAAYKISVRVKDSVAYITGTFIAPYDQFLTPAAGKSDPLFNNDPVYYHCNKKGKPYPKSLAGYPFLLINNWAKCFGKELEYQKL